MKSLEASVGGMQSLCFFAALLWGVEGKFELIESPGGQCQPGGGLQ